MRKTEKMENTTPWFDGRKKPVRRGVYQQKDGHGQTIGYQYWRGLLTPNTEGQRP